MSGRNPPLYFTPTLIAMCRHQTNQQQVQGYHSILLLYLCESEREKVHDDRGNQLSVGKGKSESIIIFMAFTVDYWDC